MTIEPLLRPRRRRSKFVTVVAWLAILSGASLTLSSASTIFFERPTVGSVAALVGGVSAMIAGAGLNQREEWARRGFIFVLVYGILAPLVEALGGHMRITAAVGFLMALVINGWLIDKLTSPGIRAEFDDQD